MTIWYVLYLISFFTAMISIVSDEKIKKYVLFLYVFFLWFVGSFRYMIGTDYETYVNLYENFFWDNPYNQYNEQTFNILIFILKEIGFSYQLLFVVYETIIILFLYFGAKNILKKYSDIMVFFILYALFFSGGYLYGLNGIRQAAAISVGVYAVSLLLRKKRAKYLFYLLLSISVHYSAVCLVITRYIFKKNISKKGVFVILVGVLIVVASGGLNIFLDLIINNIDVLLAKYGNDLQDMNSSAGSVSLSSLWIIGLFFLCEWFYTKYNVKIPVYIYNFTIAYICLRILSIFCISESIISVLVRRVEFYFTPFYLMYIVFAIKNTKYIFEGVKRQIIVISVVILLFISTQIMAMSRDMEAGGYISSRSAGNFDYEFNFKLID